MPADIIEGFKLSPQQKRLWLQQQNSVAYCAQLAIGIAGNLNIQFIQEALHQVGERHEIFRTSLQVVDEIKTPIQVIQKFPNILWRYVDLSECSKDKQQNSINDFWAEESRYICDLKEIAILRPTLITLSQQEYILAIALHSLYADGWTLNNLVREIITLYKIEDKESLAAPIQYIQFSELQNELIKSVDSQTAIKGWHSQDIYSLLNLKLVMENQLLEPREFAPKVLSCTVNYDLEMKIKAILREHNISGNVFFLACWQVLLWRLTGQSDLIVGITCNNRVYQELQDMMGLFAKCLPVQCCLEENAKFSEVITKISESIRQVEELQEYFCWEQLVNEAHHREKLPFFPYCFEFEERQTTYLADEISFTVDKKYVCFDQFKVKLSCVDIEGGLTTEFHYDSSLFSDTAIENLAEQFSTLLESAVSNSNRLISNLQILSATERQKLLFEWNNTKADYNQKQCLHQLFESVVEQTPDAVAVVFEDEQLTYSELNARANQLAHYLRSLGVKPEVLVGICVERSLPMIIGLLAILKAGGAYVPLDPSYPKEHLAYILQDTQASVLLTQVSLLEVIPQHKAKVVCLDTDWHLIEQQSQEDLFFELTTDNLAYVIYTSGSTGKPKGVQIPHIALSNFLFAMKQSPGITKEDTLLAVTTYSFDIAALELFLPIIVGGRLVITSREVALDGTQLSATLTDCQATVMQATPATWQLLLAANWDGNHQLKILCGGEVLPGYLANQLQQRCHCLWNMYGPTETTIWSAASLVETFSKTVPISQPIANTQIYILDQHHQLVPVGVAGELCIGGQGLARGYFHRPDLTAEKFIPNPFSDKAARLYKTGDLARYLPTGEIEYIGRIDYQVKIRGFRIELPEIEAALSQHSAVRETVVVVRSDSADYQQIVAYVVPQKQQTLKIAELGSFLESKLPSYMQPAAFVILEALPLTPNGKIDRKALPAPEITQQSSSSYVPPTTPIENLLAGIWAEVLGIDKVGIDNNFFELGGHSLIATRVMSQIRQVFQIELPLRCLFEKPTIAGLAKEIETANKAGLGIETTKIEPIERTSELPLSFAQQRLWFLAQLEPNNPFYNIPAAVRLQGQLNYKALQQTFDEILRRHEALRTNFQTVEGQAVAVISQTKPLILPIIDISELPLAQIEVEIRQQAAQEAQQPFDISSDYLLRVKLLRLDAQEHIVLLTMHHIASDAWSIDVLVQELAKLYPAFCNQQPSLRDATRTPLTELPIQYVDFAAWQRHWLQAQVLETQLSYWLKHLENAPKVLELPIDYPRPAIQTYRGATYSFELSKELSASLNKLSQQQGSTLYMTLLAAFQTLLWRYTGQEDIVVGSPIANRNRAEIEGLIGFFVNTLVLRTNLAGNPSFEELLKQVREVALGAYAHQDLPFELLVEQLQVERSLSHTPLFQVMFVLQNASMSVLELPGLTLTQLESDSDTAQFDLTLSMTETELGLVGSFEYNTDLFAQSSIQRMVGHLQTLLEAIVANPQQRLSDLPLLTEFEQHQLLEEWNNTAIEYPLQLCIHQVFEAQVEKTPDAVAVVFEDEQLTYSELNAKANQLAHHLRSLGVKPEVLIGLCTQRSIEMIIGLLAILKAGGAYVPIDPTYPQQRLVIVLNDAQITILLTQKNLVEKLPAHTAKVICLEEVYGQSAILDNPVNQATPTNLAYVIYTSGSTGTPKGVAIQHQSLVNFVQAAIAEYKIQSQDRILQFASISFDTACEEIFPCLLCGATLVLRTDRMLTSIPTFWEKCQQHSISVLDLPTAFWHQLTSELTTSAFKLPESLRLVIIGGEKALPDKVNTWRQQVNPRIRLINSYGPTETTVVATVCDLANVEGEVPIGRAIANVQTYVLAPDLQPVPIGVWSELYIGGVGVARGYLHQPELTQQKFIPNPFSNVPGSRLYKTGDRVRYRSDGQIEFNGRVDNQVKIRGFRIELGEIEAVLNQHPDIQQTVVFNREDRPDNKRLVAYIVPRLNKIPSFSNLRDFLKEKLPQYMVPSAFVVLEALPLTANGKIDYQQLPQPDDLPKELAAAYVAPQSPTERMLANIWQVVLNVEKVGIYDNFFDLGGHSLLAVQVHSKLREILHKDISIVDLFIYPTISSFAKYLSQEDIFEPEMESLPTSRRAALKQQRQRRNSYPATEN
jgi:amino acid adenylation domain-containing protein